MLISFVLAPSSKEHNKLKEELAAAQKEIEDPRARGKAAEDDAQASQER